MTNRNPTPGVEEPVESLRREDAIALRRKLNFWRRLAGLLGGLLVIVSILVWQRNETNRTECREALAVYAKLAESGDLASVPTELLRTEWDALEAPAARRPSDHYELLKENWGKSVVTESIPLAVCEQSHWSLMGSGRNLLVKTRQGLEVIWVPEGELGRFLGRKLAN